MAQKSKTFAVPSRSDELKKLDRMICQFLADGKKAIHQSAVCARDGGTYIFVVTIIYEDPAPERVKLNTVKEAKVTDEAPPSNADQFLASVTGASKLPRLPETEPAAATGAKTKSAPDACENCDVDSLTSCNTCRHITD